MNELTRALVNNDRLRAVLCKLRAAVELMGVSNDPDITVARELVSDSATLIDRLRIDYKKQGGSIAAVTLFCMAALIGFVTMAVGTGQYYTTTAEVQNCADAAALAGSQLLDGDHMGAITAANQLIGKNGCEVVSAEIGWWDGDSFVAGQYPELDWPVDDSTMVGPWTGAVRVVTSRALVPVFGSDLITVQRSAIGQRLVKQNTATLLWDLAKGSRLVR